MWNLPPDDPRIQPRRTWYWLPATIFLLGTLGAATWILVAIHLSHRGGKQFLVPGTCTLDVSQAQRYQLWYDAETDFAGTHYSTGPLLPVTLELQVIDLATSNELAVTPSSGLRADAGDMTRYSLGTFDVPGPARLEIRGQGNFTPRVLCAQRSRRDMLLRAFIGSWLLCAFSVIASPVMAFRLYVRRDRYRRDLYGADY